MEQPEGSTEPKPQEESEESNPLRQRSNTTQGEKPQENETEGRFECNICLDTAAEPVITMCGHLFCWPCIYEWIKFNEERPCPVCKSAVTQDKLIPLYGRGNKNQTDPRTKIPDRPQGQRTEPSRRGQGPFHPHFFQFPDQSHQFDGFAFSGGFGFFPSLFGLQFNFGTTQPRPPARELSPEELQNQFFSRVLLALGLFLVFIIAFV